MSLAALAALVLVSFAGATPAPPPASEGEGQWIYRTVSGEPTAAFLSWDYASVVFHFTCAPETGELVVEYFGADGVLPQYRREPIEFLVAGRAYPLRAETSDRPPSIRGRLAVTPGFIRDLDAEPLVEIAAPNEMGEPWYVSSAEPLKRLARRCVETR